MESSAYKVYGYRWVVLAGFMLVAALNQLLWITFAAVTSSAAQYYGVSELAIGLLSMSFLIVFILVSVPASWVIDAYGIRVAVGIGAVLTGVFGLIRGFVASDYTWVLVAQIGIAIGQPFILNAITTVAARWFPLEERATASGLGTLAIYLGILVGLALTPVLTVRYSLDTMLLLYGVVALLGVGVFFVLVKERPPTPPCPPEQDERSLMFDGLRQMLRQKDFLLLLLIFFVGLGVFNAVTTWIEEVVRPRGFSITQAGTIGGVMIMAGIAGAIITPILSDHFRKRIPFIMLALAGAIVGLIGVTYATGYGLLLLSAAVLGFFLLSAGPIGFQYGAEITFPAPEGTSNGMLLLMGQISGIVFIVGMDAFRSPTTGSMTPSLVALLALMVLSLLLSLRLPESALIAETAPAND
ncbi:MAG: major facilitator superfamily domain-containing protein 7 [Chloroflexi bacterium]|nr:major facilitator superfamily domain-containing protein 7 [Chloroflexota bacterium]